MSSAPKIRLEDLEVTHFKGSGPGGQNRNKRMTGVRVRHLPTGLVATAVERRSQSQNLDAAIERLQNKLEALYFRPTPRVPTKTTKSAKRKRVEAKRHRSKVKTSRRTSWDD